MRTTAKAVPPMFRWLTLWLILYFATLALYYAAPQVSRWLVQQLQVRPAAWILQRLLPGTPIWPQEASLCSPTLELELRRGCDGIEVWLMLITALLVFPLNWRARFRGLAWGTLLVFGMNLIRMVTIFQVALKRPVWFVVVHEFIWPTIMVLVAAGFVLTRLEAWPTALSPPGAKP